MTTATKPRYKDVAGMARPRGGRRTAMTERIIKMRPGTVLDVTPDGGAERKDQIRIMSNVRTASAETGRTYSTKKEGDRLYVVCHKSK